MQYSNWTSSNMVNNGKNNETDFVFYILFFTSYLHTLFNKLNWQTCDPFFMQCTTNCMHKKYVVNMHVVAGLKQTSILIPIVHLHFTNQLLRLSTLKLASTSHTFQSAFGSTCRQYLSFHSFYFSWSFCTSRLLV